MDNNRLNIRSDSKDWRAAILLNLAQTPFKIGQSPGTTKPGKWGFHHKYLLFISKTPPKVLDRPCEPRELLIGNG